MWKIIRDDLTADESETNLYYKNKPFRHSTHKDPPENTAIVAMLTSLVRAGLGWEYGDCYLSRKGVQMATSISIGVLYAYNLYADDCARKGWAGSETGVRGFGTSALCGDDSFRNGDENFIRTYREVIVSLGGVWSKTKDIIGVHPRGVFTELLFDGNSRLKVPKLKTLVRPPKGKEEQEAPGWKRAISALRTIDAPPHLVKSLQDEIITKFPEMEDTSLPMALSEDLGGIGRGVLSSHNLNIWSNIKRINDPVIAMEAFNLWTASLKIQTTQATDSRTYHQLLKQIPVPFTTSRETKYSLRQSRKLTKLKVAMQSLRGSIASSQALDHSREPTRFLERNGAFAAVPAISAYQAEMRLKDFLLENQVEDFAGNNVWKSGLMSRARTDEVFRSNVLGCFTTVDWANHILGRTVSNQ
jgi:hypothetical protein